MDWLLTLCVIATSVLAARAFFRTRSLAATILALKASVEVLDQRLSRLDDRPASVPQAPSHEERVGESAPLSFPAQVDASLPLAPAGRSWEEILVENWLVWLGGVALALGGAFLVKLSIDYGLLTPLVRVALGVLLGLALWAGAEWIVWGEPAELARPTLPRRLPPPARRRSSPASTPPTSSMGYCRPRWPSRCSPSRPRRPC